MYRFEKAVDLTHELANGMPVYPGDLSPSFSPAATLEKNGVNLTKLVLGSHTGTHIDAPKHFIQGGVAVDQIPASEFIGEAIVGDFSKKPIGSGITSSDLRSVLDSKIRDGDVVLCYTGSSDKWGDPTTNSNFTYLTPDGAKYLVSKKVRGFGIDFLSVEKFKAPTPATHMELLSHGIYIIESLNNNLKQFVGQRIFLIALPIKLESGDGAPCRAIAIPMD